jgi:hypothetical protein
MLEGSAAAAGDANAAATSSVRGRWAAVFFMRSSSV